MKKFFKSLQLAMIAAITAIMVFAATSCFFGGANGALASYVNAVKAGNAETASTYVDGSISVSYPKDEVSAYLWDKTVKAFSYKVEQTTEDSEKGTIAVKITYTKISQTAVMVKMGVNTTLGELFGGKQFTKADVDAALKTVDKTVDMTTLNFKTDENGKVLMTQISAAALLALMIA